MIKAHFYGTDEVSLAGTPEMIAVPNVSYLLCPFYHNNLDWWNFGQNCVEIW